MALGNILYNTTAGNIVIGDIIHAADFERNSGLQFDDATANLNVTGNVNITANANVSGNLHALGNSILGSNANLFVSGGVSGQVLSTDGSSVLSWSYATDRRLLNPAAANPPTRDDGTALVDGDQYYNSTNRITMYYTNGTWVSDVPQWFFGGLAVAPTVRDNGIALQDGDLWYDTTANSLKVWEAGAWVLAAGGADYRLVTGGAVPATRNDGNALQLYDLWYDPVQFILNFWNGSAWQSGPIAPTPPTNMSLTTVFSGNAGEQWYDLGQHGPGEYLVEFNNILFFNAPTAILVRYDGVTTSAVVGMGYDSFGSVYLNTSPRRAIAGSKISSTAPFAGGFSGSTPHVFNVARYVGSNGPVTAVGTSLAAVDAGGSSFTTGSGSNLYITLIRKVTQ